MPRRILVPMDGSPKAELGLEHALSTYPDDDITVLYVMTPYDIRGEEDPPLPRELDDEWTEHAHQDAEVLFEQAREQAAEYGVTISTALEVGEAWRRIVAYAETHDIDHIIMGSHGEPDGSSVRIGSVAETVVRRSPVLVSVVR